MRKLRPELWPQKKLADAARQCTVSHFLFHYTIVEQKQKDYDPPPTLLFSVSSTEDKTESRHFHTIEAIEVESQVVLNTPTEHDFQDAFKIGRRAGNGAYTRKGTTSRMMVISRLKVSFKPEVSNGPGNYGWLFVLY
jgi:hypothetical protein